MHTDGGRCVCVLNLKHCKYKFAVQKYTSLYWVYPCSIDKMKMKQLKKGQIIISLLELDRIQIRCIYIYMYNGSCQNTGSQWVMKIIKLGSLHF